MIICHCNEVSISEIETFIKKHPKATLSDLKESTGASSGCGRCTLLVENTFERLKNKTTKNDQLSLFFE